MDLKQLLPSCLSLSKRVKLIKYRLGISRLHCVSELSYLLIHSTIRPI